MSFYEWGAQLSTLVNAKVDAQIAGEEIERIKAKNGGSISSRKLWESQKEKEAELHSCFEWDNEEASNKYRDRQAGELIRSVKVVFEDGTGEERRVRAFSSVRDKEEPRRSVYVTTIEALTEEDQRNEILSQAVNGLISWRNRWNELVNCANAVSDIDEAIVKLKNRLDFNVSN